MASGTAEKQRIAKARYSRAVSASVRGIVIPAVVNRRRRDRCRRDLRRFCETYLAGRFTLAWSGDHLRCIGKLQTAALSGGQFAFAMPRGSGKTALAVATALWCVLYGHRLFVVLIGSTDGAAVELLDSLKTEVEANDLILADFPAAAYPVRKLEGVHNRAGGQFDERTADRTRIEWTDSQVVLPTVRVGGKPAASSGAVVRTAGITGRIRGMSHTTADGRTVRPDLVILDDPQTDESAANPAQNSKRERLLSGAVLGLGGPGVKIAAVMPCTVIHPGDLADRVLDAELHPEWNGERTKLLYSFPSDKTLWDRYAEIRAESLRAGHELTEATAFYRANRAAMDAGAAVAWEDRFNPDEASAIQHAMNLFLLDRRSFFAEYQNDPEPEDLAESKILKVDDLVRKLNSVPRLTVPRECSRLTAFIDCSKHLLWYAVTGWDERYNGGVVDWGCWPRQNRTYFEQSDARPSLGDVFKGQSESQRVFSGLESLTSEILGREYHQEDTGVPVRIERCLVDAGWCEESIRLFCRRSSFAALLYPSIGHAVGSNARPIGEWARRPGERMGPGWRLSLPSAGKGRTVVFDPDHWKTFVADRLLTPPGGSGCLSLFGTSPDAHRLIADHLVAEYATRVTVRGRTYDKWTERPDRRDNHLLDCLVGTAVAVSVQGLLWVDSGQATTVPRPSAPKVAGRKFSDIQREKRQLAGR